MSDSGINPQQRALSWLQQQGVSAKRLRPLSGYTNDVFLVEQSAPAFPKRSVLRLADYMLTAELCPLTHQFDEVVRKHREASELSLSPEVLLADRAAGVMWLAYGGEREPLIPMAFADMRTLLDRLHHSGLNWGCDTFFLPGFLEKLSSFPPVEPEDSEVARTLLQQAWQCGYFGYPMVPVHGDLNPGNLLHDGQRWWLIDWDFAGMQPREWDIAGLIVEHGWRAGQAQAFAPDIALTDLKWFCSCCALLSRYWHRQRGSAQHVIAGKSEAMQYWITLKG